MKKLILAAAAFLATTSAQAAVVFVGSWDVYSPGAPARVGAPPTGPLAYTAQEAAALQFGGAASDYQISTLGSNIATINNRAWYDVIGVGGFVFAENYSRKYLGQFYGPTPGYSCCGTRFLFSNPASAYVRDNLQGRGAINYAFRLVTAVPEPETWAMMLIGFGVIGNARRARQRVRFACF